MRTAHVYVCRSGDIEDERALQAAAKADLAGRVAAFTSIMLAR
jgi:hypothetical protein